MDGDSFGELLAGDPAIGSSPAPPGSVYVYKGSSGDELYAIDGENPEDDFGVAVAGTGDLDLGGRADFLVGAQGFPAGDRNGKVYAYAGETGLLIWSVVGEAAGDRFGRSVASVPDVDGDAIADVVVGAPRHDGPAGADAGRVYLYSGAAGTLLLAVDGSAAAGEFGRSVSGMDDVDGDGLGDFVVGAVGAATIRSGADGSPIHAFIGVPGFGFSVAGAGDVDVDGFEDAIVGSPDEEHARVYSGATGGLLEDYFWLFQLLVGEQPARFGWSVAGAGDVNGNGRADVIVGAPSLAGPGYGPGFPNGNAHVYSVPASLL